MDDKTKNQIKELLIKAGKNPYDKKIFAKILFIMKRKGVNIHDIKNIKEEIENEIKEGLLNVD